MDQLEIKLTKSQGSILLAANAELGDAKSRLQQADAVFASKQQEFLRISALIFGEGFDLSKHPGCQIEQQTDGTFLLTCKSTPNPTE